MKPRNPPYIEDREVPFPVRLNESNPGPRRTLRFLERIGWAGMSVQGLLIPRAPWEGCGKCRRLIAPGGSERISATPHRYAALFQPRCDRGMSSSSTEATVAAPITPHAEL
jgi:hypothetical protein